MAIYTWKNDAGAKKLFCGDKLIGTIPYSTGNAPYKDTIEEVSEGIFKWVRRFDLSQVKLRDSLRLVMEFVAEYHSDYTMIPAVSYNGNQWGNGAEPKGFVRDGQPWTFAYHRASIAGATYSEGLECSVGLFGFYKYDAGDYSCSVIPEETQTIHRLIWPEEETPLVYSEKNKYTALYKSSIPLTLGDTFTTTAYLVINTVEEPHQATQKLLNFAWNLGCEETRCISPMFSVEKIWELGVTYAKESLWAEEGSFKGFSIGLKWNGTGWQQRPHWKYEIGWAGQNASLANSLLYDYIKNADETSLEKGLTALDTWATHCRLDNGLFRCHFDYVLGQNRNYLLGEEMGEVQDACNLGGAALNYFEAHHLAKKCGVERPKYREIAVGICDFAIQSQFDDGRFGRCWTNDGTCIDSEGSTGAFLIKPLIVAYQNTNGSKYLNAAEKAYAYYVTGLVTRGFTTAGALDTHCVDKESAIPLLDAGLALYEITGDLAYLQHCERASYYLATWQWHYNVMFPEGTVLYKLGYTTFGGTGVSTQHHHIDAYALYIVPHWLKLAELTGNNIWRQRALAIWGNATIGISDGTLEVLDRKRPIGSQDEAFFQTRWGRPFSVSELLVAWPTAFRLEVLRKLDD